jgi:hypothetical protein
MSLPPNRALHLRSGTLVALLAIVGCQDAAVPTTPPSVQSAPSFDRAAGFEMSVLGDQLAALRRVTAPFHDIAVAADAGYDAPLTPCWYYGSEGAMGYHYGNPSFIDGTPELLRPEILVYAPDRDGDLHLVAIEYIVPIPMWSGSEPPSLVGQEFERNDALGLYALHLWLWRNNPNGMFADWNPKVSCAGAAESEDRSES